MPIGAVVYTSRMSQGVSEYDVVSLSRRAAVFNQMAGVSGVVVSDGVSFLQYFEGPEDGVEGVYGRIRGSSSHFELRELVRFCVASRVFPYWSMHQVRVSGVTMRQLLEADWTPSAMEPDTLPAGLRLLLEVLGSGARVSRP